MMEGKSSQEERSLEIGFDFRGSENASDLRGEDKFMAWLLIEKTAHPMLAEAKSVPGRRIKVADTTLPGCLQSCQRVLLAHPCKELPEPGCPEPELCQFDGCAA